LLVYILMPEWVGGGDCNSSILGAGVGGARAPQGNSTRDRQSSLHTPRVPVFLAAPPSISCLSDSLCRPTSSFPAVISRNDYVSDAAKQLSP
jgi:hypothetical protein